jgi:hypothetical protein
MGDIIISNQDKAEKQVDALKEYLDKTPLEKVPINQFKRANRKTIMEELGISGSKDHSDVKRIFHELDVKVSGQPAPACGDTNNEMQVKNLQQRIDELEKKLSLAGGEISRFKKIEGIIDHLIKTGAVAK